MLLWELTSCAMRSAESLSSPLHSVLLSSLPLSSSQLCLNCVWELSVDERRGCQLQFDFHVVVISMVSLSFRLQLCSDIDIVTIFARQTDELTHVLALRLRLCLSCLLCALRGSRGSGRRARACESACIAIKICDCLHQTQLCICANVY